MNVAALDNYEYISFDIFDTLVTRTYTRPADVFREMEARLVDDHPGLAGFARARIAAELESRRKGNFSREVTLEEIYAELASRLEPAAGMLEQLRQLELSLEKACIVVNEDARRLLGRLRDNGKKILFLSDIYLPDDFIREILVEHDLLRDEDSLYVSSQTGKMKSSGGLFEHVLQENAITPHRLCHIGDNPESDVSMPARHGIASLHYNSVHASRYLAPPENNTLLSKIAALSKLTRLADKHAAGTDERVIWNVTADVSAPMIFAFVNWTIQQARERGIHRLYYLARDGQVMHRIATRIIDRFYRGEIEARYLYVSRQSLLFPATRKPDRETFEWIMAPTALLTLRIVLNRINFGPEEIYHLLCKYRLQDLIDSHLDEPARKRTRQLLQHMWPLIQGRARDYRRNTIGYFRQEGLFDPGSQAVVDIGWSGTLQRSISRLLGMQGDDRPVAGFYFGLKNRKKHKESDSLHAWFTDCRSPRALDKKTYIIPMTELFTAADHGGVWRHEYRDGSYIPVLRDSRNRSGLHWGVRVQQEAMLAYTEKALHMGREALENSSGRYLGFFERNYEKLLLDPTHDEARVYGGYMDAEDQNEAYHVPLAAKYSCFGLLRLALTRRWRHHNEWRQGSFRLTRCFLKKALVR